MTVDKNPEKINKMFNKIAYKYDFINNVMSLNTQHKIKQKSIELLNINSGDNILDLCCGTGDLAILAKKDQPQCQIIGVDFSEKMLEIAKRKSNEIQFLQADATNLPFEDNFFDIITMGFGLRNIQNTEKAIIEVYRVLKPNGKFLHLDFGKKNILSKIYDIFVSFISRFFTNNKFAYSYLIESKKVFPTPDELVKDFESKGFQLEKRKDFLLGIISVQILKKL